MPPDVTLVRWVCENPGVHGACNNAAIVAATDGVRGDELVARLVEHYRHAGWPLEVRADFPHLGHWGCRPVRGILPWEDHCMQITTEQHVSAWQTYSAPAQNEAIIYVNPWQEA